MVIFFFHPRGRKVAPAAVTNLPTTTFDPVDPVDPVDPATLNSRKRTKLYTYILESNFCVKSADWKDGAKRGSNSRLDGAAHTQSLNLRCVCGADRVVRFRFP